MKPENQAGQVHQLLNDMEQALKVRNLWEGMPPSMEALASTTPFCIDTMTFTQWLQWIFIPRMRALLDAGSPLPQGSDIAPYAEESFKVQRMENPAGLLGVIKKLDESLQ